MGQDLTTGEGFVGVQLGRPYRYWRHEHRFAAAGEHTEVVDRVEYEIPLGPLGELAHLVDARRSLDGLFRFRSQAVARLLETGEAMVSPAPGV